MYYKVSEQLVALGDFLKEAGLFGDLKNPKLKELSKNPKVLELLGEIRSNRNMQNTLMNMTPEILMGIKNKDPKALKELEKVHTAGDLSKFTGALAILLGVLFPQAAKGQDVPESQLKNTLTEFVKDVKALPMEDLGLSDGRDTSFTLDKNKGRAPVQERANINEGEAFKMDTRTGPTGQA